MSGLIGVAAGGIQAGLGALGVNITPLLTDWRSRLLPASFRGVPFFVRRHSELGGRRAAIHEFPLRDVPATEDLGSAIRRYTIDGYLVGDDYDLNRDRLRAAVYDAAGPGTLVHPYLGTLTVQPVEGCSVTEDKDRGRIAEIRLVCVQAGDVSQSRAGVDTVAGVLNGVKAVIKDIKAFYTLGVLIATRPGFVLQALTAGLEDLAGAVLGLPNGVVQGLAGTIDAIFADPSSTAGTADAADAAFAAVGDALVTTPPAGDDPTGGLAGLATATFVTQPTIATTAAAATQAANANALNYFANGLAAATAASIYAQTDFISAQAAAAARAALIAMIGAMADAAANIGDANGYTDWLALEGLVAADLIDRAQALPQLGNYALNASVPSLALAQRLYAAAATTDAADQLMRLNDALHPLFMPPAGSWLEAA